MWKLKKLVIMKVGSRIVATRGWEGWREGKRMANEYRGAVG
jgi:hypothetical protein